MKYDWRDYTAWQSNHILSSEDGVLHIEKGTDRRKIPVRNGNTICVSFNFNFIYVKEHHKIKARQILEDLTGSKGARVVKGHWRWYYDEYWGVSDCYYEPEVWLPQWYLIYPITTEHHYKHSSGERGRCIFKIGKLSTLGLDDSYRGPIQHGIGLDHRFLIPYEEKYLECENYIRLRPDLEDDLDLSCENPWIFGYDETTRSYELRFSSTEELMLFTLRWG
jgi:hypothetical protein